MKKYIKMIHLRKKLNISQEELAKKIGVSKQYIWDIENGYRTLSYKMAFLIAFYLGVTPDDIFYNNKEK